ncbi:MAG TPA: MOSC domain-containing protein [Streptosporangiaceae bacterium]|nr:MOSC domain-containing protein [Streptosporangiaceae bacterium]
MGQVVSVNVGQVLDMPWAKAKEIGRTAIDKRPVATRVAVRRLGVDGDEQADKDNHGGPEQAVYAYAREDLDWWAERLGDGELRNGIFGENLTVRGVDVNAALLDECWRVGDALLQVTGPRVPCGTFRAWMDRPGWVKRFTEAERTGAYLRVLEEGEVGPGDPIVIEHRPERGVTVTESFRAYHGDQELMRRILAIPGHSASWDEAAERVLRGSA